MRRLVFTGLLGTIVPFLTFGQGFGQGIAKLKKTITLQRKLPAAVQLPGSTFAVKAIAPNPQYRDVAEKLRQMVETELVRFNSQLSPNPDAPDSIITMTVSNFNVPPPVATSDPYAAPFAVGNKKNSAPQQPTAYTITGTLALTYQARTRTGRSLDAQPITVKFAEEINTASKTKELIGKIPHPGKSKATEEDHVHTAGDVEQILVTRAAERVAARLVNTDERVEALLARGALDEYNRYAEAGQWTDLWRSWRPCRPCPVPRTMLTACITSAWETKHWGTKPRLPKRPGAISIRRSSNIAKRRKPIRTRSTFWSLSIALKSRWSITRNWPPPTPQSPRRR